MLSGVCQTLREENPENRVHIYRIFQGHVRVLLITPIDCKTQEGFTKSFGIYKNS